MISSSGGGGGSSSSSSSFNRVALLGVEHLASRKVAPATQRLGRREKRGAARCQSLAADRASLNCVVSPVYG